MAIFASKIVTAMLQLFIADTDSHLSLAYADGGIRAGFPSPAQDYISETIDLNRVLVKHPSATFYARVTGDSMEEEGIADGDLLIIDKSLQAEHGDLAVCCLNGEFTLKRLRYCDGGARMQLMPSNRRYRPIDVTPDDDFMVWGVVTHTVKTNRRRPRHLDWN